MQQFTAGCQARSSGLLSTGYLDSFLVPHNKRCTFLHHKPVTVDWLYCRRASGPKFGSVTILDSRPWRCQQEVPIGSCSVTLSFRIQFFKILNTLKRFCLFVCFVFSFKELRLRDFPGGPVVKTPRFHCKGSGFDPWSRN